MGRHSVLATRLCKRCGLPHVTWSRGRYGVCQSCRKAHFVPTHNGGSKSLIERIRDGEM